MSCLNNITLYTEGTCILESLSSHDPLWFPSVLPIFPLPEWLNLESINTPVPKTGTWILMQVQVPFTWVPGSPFKQQKSEHQSTVFQILQSILQTTFWVLLFLELYSDGLESASIPVCTWLLISIWEQAMVTGILTFRSMHSPGSLEIVYDQNSMLWFG